MITTGGELRAWRQKAGVSQAALARLLGVSPEHLCRLENENRALLKLWQWALEGVQRSVGVSCD